MNADYPAAHSMDTRWFAVDGAGQVGIFWTDETGHLPVGTENDVTQLVRPTEDYLSREELAQHLGLFAYVYDDQYSDEEPLNPYMREYAPERSAHLFQFPASIRKLIEQATFPRANFAESPLLQPLEHRPCSYWTFHAEYIASDGLTRYPVPGYVPEEDDE